MRLRSSPLLAVVAACTLVAAAALQPEGGAALRGGGAAGLPAVPPHRTLLYTGPDRAGCAPPPAGPPPPHPGARRRPAQPHACGRRAPLAPARRRTSASAAPAAFLPVPFSLNQHTSHPTLPTPRLSDRRGMLELMLQFARLLRANLSFPLPAASLWAGHTAALPGAGVGWDRYFTSSQFFYGLHPADGAAPCAGPVDVRELMMESHRLLLYDWDNGGRLGPAAAAVVTAPTLCLVMPIQPWHFMSTLVAFMDKGAAAAAAAAAVPLVSVVSYFTLLYFCCCVCVCAVCVCVLTPHFVAPSSCFPPFPVIVVSMPHSKRHPVDRPRPVHARAVGAGH